ncbi:flagellar motor protein [Thermosyntropha sp.]|uniref:flagellar motor protein n=1 Tax=Thermosyntropha sp. TaxID=2740820 RepID=UPI0025DFE81D|nr:flagellar motor protein [Thermosyntropha sp.]MBO8159025.1 flagellar motor protein [Thermosyntropha sp.]
MDIATLIGLLIGLGGLIGGFVLEGGHVGMLLIHTAAMIVFGGTIGAVVISFPLDELKKVPSAFAMVFSQKRIDYISVVEELVGVADRARREGILSLENYLPEIENPFMARGLQLVIDGTDPDLTRNMLEMEIEAFESEESVKSEIFTAAGGYAPTMGIIGTVMGLVHVLSNISEPDKLGGAIALAFIATLYGVSSANVLWLPFGTKVRMKIEKEVRLMELITEGILSVQAGENPRIIREKLFTFIPPEAKMERQAEAGREVRM